MIESELLPGIDATSPNDENIITQECNMRGSASDDVVSCKKRARTEEAESAPSKKTESNPIQRTVTNDELFGQLRNKNIVFSGVDDMLLGGTHADALNNENASTDEDFIANSDMQEEQPVFNQPDNATPKKDNLVERWTCDICKSCSFETYDEAQSHEVQCRLQIENQKSQMSEAADALTSLLLSGESNFNTSESENSEGPVQNEETLSENPFQNEETISGNPVQNDETLSENPVQNEETISGNPVQNDETLSDNPVQNEETLSDALSPRNPSINLIPQGNDSSMLSDYNNLLVRNIEFFYPSRTNGNSPNDSKSGSDVSDKRLGLRCIHCADIPQHITAATFFPSSIGSIASGLGTIGSRHFGWGKCPSICHDTVQQMIETKKTSGLQTRVNGRIGLDAYCKNIAKEYNIFNDDRSGICWIEGASPSNQANVHEAKKNYNHEPTKCYPGDVDHNAVASVLASMKHDTSFDGNPHAPFRHSDTDYFWECKGCKSVPFQFRSKGSVVFSVGEPERDIIANHLRNCNGDRALSIPRTATIEPFYGETIPPIRVKWDGEQAEIRSSNRTVSRSSRKSSDEITVKTGVEESSLAFPDDKQFTTDFAFYTVMQLKKCYLTKSGGSRGSCPVGYPGLACSYCAGSQNERRFFYTSADHLRNSFAHIPAHIVECSACPSEVKTRLDSLKEIRNRQKSQLKTGYHKIFIDRVWDKLHGSPQSDDDSSIGSMPIFDEDTNNTINNDDTSGNNIHSSQVISKGHTPSVLPFSSELISDSDRNSTSDFNAFTLLQVTPYNMFGQNIAKDQGTNEIGFPGLVCRHCMCNKNGRKFFTTSVDHLSDLLHTVSNHILVCKDCPDAIKSKIMSFKLTHEDQLQYHLSSGEHNRLMQRVWNQLSIMNMPNENAPASKSEPVQYEIVDPNKSLTTVKEERLVTPYTYYTMQQVRPCNLGHSGSSNGSRSTFDYGFPGLECIHCAGFPNSRRFFYRTSEILGGNYAHIPNHLMGCIKCPPEVKRKLAEKKELHLSQKAKLDRGSQRIFFNLVWKRLHARS